VCVGPIGGINSWYRDLSAGLWEFAAGLAGRFDLGKS